MIGLVSFNWEHTMNKPLNIDNRYLRERRVPQRTRAPSSRVQSRQFLRLRNAFKNECLLEASKLVLANIREEKGTQTQNSGSGYLRVGWGSFT